MVIRAAGTRNRIGVMLNVLSIASSVDCTFAESPAGRKKNPNTMKMRRVINIDGPVVRVMYRMCVKISVPAIAGARFVVSERGDILSPK